MPKQEIAWTSLIKKTMQEEKLQFKEAAEKASKIWKEIKAGTHSKYIQGKPTKTAKKSKKSKKSKTAKKSKTSKKSCKTECQHNLCKSCHSKLCKSCLSNC